MISFATEFPVGVSKSSAAFLAQVIAWLRGTTYSTILDDGNKADLDGEAPVLRAECGEELRLRLLKVRDVEVAVGFRHDFPDDAGRVWRTETVLRKAAGIDGQDMLRLRTQCLARRADAVLEVPRKPYLIKAVLKDGWGGLDGRFEVSDKPIWLPDDQQGLDIARAAIGGSATRHLPIVYVSATGKGRWSLTRSQIERLAFDLGGVAHVVVEPDRGFSFHLRDATSGRNAYGGAVGLALPDKGLARRYFMSGRLAEPRDFKEAIREIASAVRSQMPADGWDWTELQEQALRNQRERDRARLSLADTQALYEEEIANLKDQIDQLKEQLAASRLDAAAEVNDSLFPASLDVQLGPEIYHGELVDRLRSAAQLACARADQDGLDSRSRAVLGEFAALPPTPGLIELLEDLKRATKDPNRLAGELTQLLSRHGYREKSHNRHVRLEPLPTLKGLEAITVPTTPSDDRGLKNQRKQVERTLGLTKLQG